MKYEQQCLTKFGQHNLDTMYAKNSNAKKQEALNQYQIFKYTISKAKESKTAKNELKIFQYFNKKDLRP